MRVALCYVNGYTYYSLPDSTENHCRILMIDPLVLYISGSSLFGDTAREGGYLKTGQGKKDWLTGSPMGWRGPWGTTYAVNLRLSVESYTEDQWVDLLHNRNKMPGRYMPILSI